MRISVLGYNRGDASQNTIRIAQAWALQGHNIQTLDFGESDILRKILQFQPEFVLVTMGREFDHSTLKVLRDKNNILLVQWIPDEYGPDDGAPGEWLKKIKGVYNLLMLETKGLVHLLKDYADEVIWVHQFFDQRYHTYRGKTPEFSEVWDIGFLGGPNLVQSSERVEFLTGLVKDGYDVKVGGGNWKGILPDKNIYQSGRMLVGSDMASFYKHTKIGVNFANDLLPQYMLGFSNRVMKTMGCGCFLLTHDIERLDYMFDPNGYPEIYFNYEDFKSQIDRYLVNPDVRIKEAKAAQKDVLKNYNIDKVTANFIAQIKERLEI